MTRQEAEGGEPGLHARTRSYPFRRHELARRFLPPDFEGSRLPRGNDPHRGQKAFGEREDAWLVVILVRDRVRDSHRFEHRRDLEHVDRSRDPPRKLIRERDLECAARVGHASAATRIGTGGTSERVMSCAPTATLSRNVPLTPADGRRARARPYMERWVTRKRSRVNRDAARSRAALPRASRVSPSSRSSRMAAASAAGSRGLTVRPQSGGTCSGRPPTAVATIGLPQSIASSVANGNPSETLDRATTSAFENAATVSGVNPSKLTAFSSPSCACKARQRSRYRSLPGGALPKSRKRTSGRVRKTIAAPRRSVSTSLSGSMRPAHTTTGAAFGGWSTAL